MLPSSISSSHRDFWPPTQMRLGPTMALSDEDPLTYFLTPAPAAEDMDMDDVVMEFDAGIEDSNNPRETVRSVSPSTLDGLQRNRTKSFSPEPELSDGPSPYEDDSDEEYIRFHPGPLGLPHDLRDFTVDGLKSKKALKTKTTPQANDTNLTPATPHVTRRRGRASSRTHGLGHRRTGSTRSPHHLWREPSPDVWSIEEETEEELNSEMGSSAAPSEMGDDDRVQIEDKQLDIPAAKPKKRVRFVLPAKD